MCLHTFSLALLYTAYSNSWQPLLVTLQPGCPGSATSAPCGPASAISCTPAALNTRAISTTPSPQQLERAVRVPLLLPLLLAVGLWVPVGLLLALHEKESLLPSEADSALLWAPVGKAG